MSVRASLIFASIFLGACAGTVRRPVEAPTPVTRASSGARSDLPPLVMPPDSANGGNGSTVPVAELPVTVLPTIVGHRATKSAQPARAGGTVSRDGSDQTVRIALGLSERSVTIAATGVWSVYDVATQESLGELNAGDDVSATARDGTLLLVGAVRQSVRGAMVARPSGGASYMNYGGHRYRGELVLVPSGDRIVVVNRLGVEDYLRGVVPLEIGGDRTQLESAAVEAQAIAARSFTYTRMDDSRPYDMVATTADQVYGGVDAERPLSDAAISVTRNMVMMYDGKVINAPYHANSGGVTAAASEVWRSGDEPYLVSVSDRIPGTDHYYGEDAPRFHWTRTLSGAELGALLDKYLPRYSSARAGNVGTLRKITESGRTPSGRVAGLVFETDRGSFAVRGNDVRSVLRGASGDILPSTLFTFEQTTDRKGRLTSLTIHGSGNGHGVGMDQWGAIARARAGQDALSILRTYYPGTTIGRVI